MIGDQTYRLLAVADSDSYAKWAAGVIDALPQEWNADLTIVRTPIAPSRQQIDAAVSGTRLSASPPKTLAAKSVRQLVSSTSPDVVFLAATGPVVDVLMSRTLAGIHPRPAFVSGLPGISVPATERALMFRSAADLFVVHSHREVGEFKQLAASMGIEMDIALGTLPSLASVNPPAERSAHDRIVFAPQALVPHTRSEREQILLALAGLAERRPDLTPVVKQRAMAGEAQTHRERLSDYDVWRDLTHRGRVKPDAVHFENGPMLEHLQCAAGFVTVSSTAALEALASDVPTLVLSDFGVSAEMINLVFEGSGLLGTLEDLTNARFFQPDPSWLNDNYFHPHEDTDLVQRLAELAGAARHGMPRVKPARMDSSEYARSRRRSAMRLSVHPGLFRAYDSVARRLYRSR